NTVRFMYYFDRPMFVFKFIISFVRYTIRKNNTINTEVTVMQFFSKVSAISKDRITMMLTNLYAMITPFPYKPANKTIILFYKCLISVQVTRGIPHCVCVFAKNKWFI